MNEYKVWLAKLLTLGLIFIVGMPILIGALAAVGIEKGPKVSVVELNGVIEDSREVLEALYQEVRDDQAKGLVLRIDSPGGAVGPSEEIYNAVRRLKAQKPIVVSMGSVAASGGLYAAVGASKIFAQSGTQTGSIGVIMQLPNFANVADKVGITMVTVKSGALKDTGNPFRSMTDEERKFLEDTTAKIHGNFIKAVAEGRNIPEAKVREFADGRLILGSEAKELGLVDNFGDIYDAATEALKLAGHPLKGDQVPSLIYANRKKGVLTKMLEGSSDLPGALVSYLGSGLPVWRYIAG